MEKRTRKAPDRKRGPSTCILTGDWHIRATVPVCRTDDFLAAMWKKVDFILDLSVEHRVPILVAGDVGLKSQWPNWLEEEFIKKHKKTSPAAGKLTGIYDIPGPQER